jgi:hypothetical protein
VGDGVRGVIFRWAGGRGLQNVENYLPTTDRGDISCFGVGGGEGCETPSFTPPSAERLCKPCNRVKATGELTTGYCLNGDYSIVMYLTIIAIPLM